MPYIFETAPNIKTLYGDQMAKITSEYTSVKNVNRTMKIISNSFALIFFAANLCIAQQTPAQAKCPAVAEFLAVLGQKKVFEPTPDLFLQSATTQLKTTKDETKALSSSEKMRILALASTTGDWLNTGESVYKVVKDTASFNSLTLDINKTCFGAPKEFIELGQSAIGKGGKKIKMPPPDASESIFWRWKDPDINMIRTLELSASKDSFSIQVKRDPDSEGVAE
jgi:hypothetical protein